MPYHLIMDVEAGVKRFGGKRERYFSSLLSFAQGLPEKKLHHQSLDLQREVHAIKGVSGNLGIISLYNEAICYEQMIKSGESLEETYHGFYDTCAEAGKAILQKFGH